MCNCKCNKTKADPVSEPLPAGGLLGKLVGTLGKLLPKKK